MAKVRCLFADCVGVFEIPLNTALISDSGKMKHTVGTATKSHISSNCVFKCSLSHNVTGTDVLFNKVHNLHTCMFSKLDSL